MSSQTPVWFITGTSSGFGQSIAFEALKRSHKVIATARRVSALDSLKAAGADILEFDVTAPEATIDAKVKEAHDIYGKLTYVVNAAGYVLEGTCEEASEKEVFDQFNTNVFGTIKVTHAVIPYLRAQPTSAIANFGSLASWVGGPAVAFYNASKWAVSGFSEAMTAELAAFNIAVTCVEPGYFRTAFLNAGNRNKTAKRLGELYAGKGGAEEYRAVLDQQDNKQLGDVKKGAKVVVDVLTKTGVAEGREIPIRLALGTDCLEVIRGKCEGTVKLLKEWEDISASTDHDN
ncbi:Fc.00g022680.m01.CDS01 [Cosmosporella sp. VM-42]